MSEILGAQDPDYLQGSEVVDHENIDNTGEFAGGC